MSPDLQKASRECWERGACSTGSQGTYLLVVLCFNAMLHIQSHELVWHPPCSWKHNERIPCVKHSACPKLSQGCDNPGRSQGTGTRQHPLATAHSRKYLGYCSPVAFERVVCLSPINFQQIKDRGEKEIIKQCSSSSRALSNLFSQFPTQTVPKTNHVTPV